MQLQEEYKKEISPKLKEKLGCKNVFEVPKLQKVVLNVGFGRHIKEKEYVESVMKGLTRVAGQKPVATKAKKSISAFKLREGSVIGACVTLRGKRMYNFIEKLINVSFPRVRDFQGISIKSIDQKGNMTVGFREHLFFPEIGTDEIENVFGLEICMSTSAKTKEEGIELFRALGFPFKD